MAQLDLDPALLRRFGITVLRIARTGRLDVRSVVRHLLEQDVDRGVLSPAQARETRLIQEWTVGLTRAVAALADLGVVLDGGDVPAIVSVRPGTRLPEEGLAQAVVNAVMRMPLRESDVSQAAAPLEALRGYLLADHACAHNGIAEAVPGLAELWLMLCDLHDSAALDVSQRPNDRMLIAVRLAERTLVNEAEPVLPAAYAARVQGKIARARAEADHLHRFFGRERTCLNVRLAQYFNVEVPDGCCATDRVRCSVCAGAEGGPGTVEGTPLNALVHGSTRPAPVDSATRAARLDASVARLLAAAFRGLTPRRITSVLTGKDREWVARLSTYRPLPRWLREVPQFGAHPDVTAREVDLAIDRLVAAGTAVREQQLARTTTNSTRGARSGQSRRGRA